MTIGLAVWGVPADQLTQLALSAEHAGIDAIWLAERAVLPTTLHSTNPAPGTQGLITGGQSDSTTPELLDPLISLGAAAAVTSSVTLGTGVYLLPLRHPLATARSAATLQALSGDRFTLGIGAGWLREEFDALGVSFEKRGRITDEALSVVRAALRGGATSFDGEFFSFESIQVTAQPVSLPIILGGNSETAIRRAVRFADGWMCAGLPDVDEAVTLARRVEHLRDQLGTDRDFDLYFRMPGCDPANVRRYREAGIHNIILYSGHILNERSASEWAKFLGGFTEASK